MIEMLTNGHDIGQYHHPLSHHTISHNYQNHVLPIPFRSISSDTLSWFAILSPPNRRVDQNIDLFIVTLLTLFALVTLVTLVTLLHCWFPILGGTSKKTVFFGNFSQNGGGPHFPKLLYNYQVIFGMPNSS